MTEAYVNRLASALGGRQASVDDSARVGLLASAPELLREAGFEYHHLSSQGTTAYDLAHTAVKKLGKLEQISTVIYATCLPLNGNLGDTERFTSSRDVKHLMDFPVSHLQADFGLEDADVIGLNQQACTSLLGSLRLARSLLISEPAARGILCVTSDRFPPGAIYEQAYNLISDGAAACLVTRKPGGFRIVATHAIANGALARASDDEVVGSFFSYMHKLITETLARAGMSIGEVAWIIPQNMNRNAWKILSRLIEFDADRVCFDSMPAVGHIISADNIVNLQRLDESGRIQAGDRLLLVMAGFGLNWQAVVLEKCQ
ncbi:MAG: 3-oxoacyl-[acyl-carrier-protein] synthase III C-terminal domain-containing protein [Acidobacteriota bacterium]